MTLGLIVLGLQIVITMSPRMENKSSNSSNIRSTVHVWHGCVSYIAEEAMKNVDESIELQK